MLRMSRLADYAAVIMQVLATTDGKRLSAASMARQTFLTASTVSKLLKLLYGARLVTAKQGALGGYQLKNIPDRITVVDIITAIDGRLGLTVCATEEGFCAHAQTCRLRRHWQWMSDAVFQVLNRVTLSMLATSSYHAWAMGGPYGFLFER